MEKHQIKKDWSKIEKRTTISLLISAIGIGTTSAIIVVFFTVLMS